MMKKIVQKLKKVTMVVFAAALVCFATACGDSKEKANQEKLRVGIVQLIDNGAFEDMREGFIQELRDRGYTEDKLEILYENAQGDATNLNTICQNMVSNKVDLVATIATPAAEAMVNQESEIPVIFISVSNPVGAGIISDMEHPDRNATGTSNAIPIHEIFDLAEELTPGKTTYGLLYTTSEINSVTTINQAKEYLTSIGCEYVESVVTNSSEVQQAAQALVGKVDAIFIPNDSVIQSAVSLVAEIANEAQIPVYASSATTVASGAFATIAISDTEIGKLSADMAIDHLEGKKIEEIPAIVVPASDTVVNRQAMEALGITISADKATIIDTAQ